MTRPRRPDVHVAGSAASLLALSLLLGLGSCSDSAEPAPERDPAAAASAAIDERVLQPQDPTRAAEASGEGPEPAAGLGPAQDRSHTPAGSLGGEVIAHYDLNIDDCFDRVESAVSGRSSATTTRVPCSTPHMFQVFARLDYPADASAAYPGDVAIEDFALQSCYLLFGQWADSVYETSVLEIEALTPVMADFSDPAYPYRGIHCLVRRDDHEPLAGSARSSGL